MTYHILILVSVMVLANVVSCLLPSIDHDDILDDLGNLNFLDNLDLSQLHVDQVGDDDVVIAVFVVLSVALSISTIDTSRYPDQTSLSSLSMFSHSKSVNEVGNRACK
jgi:hypothetical protein